MSERERKNPPRNQEVKNARNRFGGKVRKIGLGGILEPNREFFCSDVMY